MSQLETAMGLTIAVFDKYAKTDGNRQTLTKAELKTLLEKELPNFLSVREQYLYYVLSMLIKMGRKQELQMNSEQAGLHLYLIVKERPENVVYNID
ncbi:PREDICTED: protein S100-A9-like, partial [Leptosomus discolor]|uniref:protein S100-A9-like n=1 Tax=Leptosomus discolor TaxID=188344 RepID=UPI0005227A05